MRRTIPFRRHIDPLQTRRFAASGASVAGQSAAEAKVMNICTRLIHGRRRNLHVVAS